VLAFFDRHLGLHSPQRRKLSVQVFGSGQAMPGEEAKEEEKAEEKAAAPPAATEKAAAAAAADATTTAEEGASKDKPEGGEEQEPLAPAPAVPGEVVAVTNAPQFQRERPLYPLRTPPAARPARSSTPPKVAAATAKL
jgi:hypothetical protein